MRKLMGAYCDRSGQDPVLLAPGATSLLIVAMQAAVRFFLECERIQPTDTPAQLDMEEGDVVDVF